MKATIPGGCRIYNHRHFPNRLHAKFLELKKKTGKTLEELIIIHLEFALEMGGVSKSRIRAGVDSIKTVSKIENARGSKIENDRTWHLVKGMINGIPTLSDDMIMPKNIIPLMEETP